MSWSDLLRNLPLCGRLGIEYPVCQAGMGHVAYGELAAAVSEAGGLGVIGSGNMSADELRSEIRLVRARTRKPFGVDILFATVAGTDSISAQFTERVQALIEVTLAERVPVLVSGLGNPAAVVARAHANGMVVMSVVGNVRQAQKLEANGIDVIIASGLDGGGHVGRVGTMALVPAVVDAVKVPVIAGGGLADGRGLVAALALGAQGVWLGTRFIATHEARAHLNYKQKLVEIGEEGTVVTRAHSGKPCRLVINGFTRSWEGREHEIKPYPIQRNTVGEPASRLGRLQGDIEHGVLPAGQSVGLIHEIKGAGEIVHEVMDEARAVLARWEGVRARPAAVPGAAPRTA
ncbi:MAG: nitronate monooxygenase [Candidatus Lambdaproteobacteria bacterium]|nr:nitronate monooxygenase [Candidatus Lambdaproteobacteria bacterium]